MNLLLSPRTWTAGILATMILPMPELSPGRDMNSHFVMGLWRIGAQGHGRAPTTEVNGAIPWKLLIRFETSHALRTNASDSPNKS